MHFYRNLCIFNRSQQEKKPSTDYSNSTSNETDGHPYFHVAVYSGLIGGVFILELIKALFFFKIAVDSSRNLHDTMLTKVLRTNIAFFATNTSGRVFFNFIPFDISLHVDSFPIQPYLKR